MDTPEGWASSVVLKIWEKELVQSLGGNDQIWGILSTSKWKTAFSCGLSGSSHLLLCLGNLLWWNAICKILALLRAIEGIFITAWQVETQLQFKMGEICLQLSAIPASCVVLYAETEYKMLNNNKKGMESIYPWILTVCPCNFLLTTIGPIFSVSERTSSVKQQKGRCTKHVWHTSFKLQYHLFIVWDCTCTGQLRRQFF